MSDNQIHLKLIGHKIRPITCILALRRHLENHLHKMASVLEQIKRVFKDRTLFVQLFFK